MQLQDFITQKQSELQASGLYKEVSIHSIDQVMLSGRIVGESFLTTCTPHTQLGHEVKVGQFPDVPRLPFKENGTKVIFEVVEKRKRKPKDITFYFLWEVAG